MDEIQITDSLKKFTDSPYALADLASGWDCVNMLLEFYGPKLPRQFGDWTEQNYAGRWRADEATARKVLRQYLLSLGCSIPRNYMLPGDLILCEQEKEKGSDFALESDPFSFSIPMFPAIYQGNAHVLINWGLKKGVRSIPLRFIEPIIIDVRRI